MPGFQQFRRSDARTANPTSQGATLRALGGNASSRALLMLDGVPQTDPFGGWIAWPAFDPRRLGRVRVVARRRQRRQRARRARRHDRARKRRAGRSRRGGRRLSYGSRDSVDAFAGYGAHLGARLRQRLGAPMRAATASSPSSRASAGPPTAPRPTARRASPRARSRRSPARSSFRPISPPSPTNASAAPRSARSARAAPTPRCGWSAAAACPSRRSPMSRSAISPTGSPRSAPTARPPARRSTNIACPRPGSARASRSARSPARSSCGSAPTGARPRDAPRRCSSSSPARRTRGRVAGGRDRHARRLRRGRLGAWRADPHRRRPARPLADRQRVAPGADPRRPARSLTDTAFPGPERLGADRARRPRLAGGARRSPCAPPPISAGACRPSTSSTARSASAPTPPPPMPRSPRSGCEGLEAGLEIRPARARADRRHPVRQSPDRRHRQRDAGPGAGHFPRRRLRRRRRPVPDARECRRRSSAAASRSTRSVELGRFRLAAGYSFADAEVRAERRGGGARRPAPGPDAAPQLHRQPRLAGPARRLCLGGRALRLRPI